MGSPSLPPKEHSDTRTEKGANRDDNDGEDQPLREEADAAARGDAGGAGGGASGVALAVNKVCPSGTTQANPCSGTKNNDLLIGTNGPDYIKGLVGNDNISGGGATTRRTVAGATTRTPTATRGASTL